MPFLHELPPTIDVRISSGHVVCVVVWRWLLRFSNASWLVVQMRATVPHGCVPSRAKQLAL